MCLCKTTFRGGCGVPRGDRGLGSDQNSCMTFTPCPSRVGPSVSGRIAELWRRRHPGPLQSPRRPAGGEETGASGGSRGPNSVTRSLPGLSTGNPGLPAGCGKVREGPRPAHGSPDESKHRSRARGSLRPCSQDSRGSASHLLWAGTVRPGALLCVHGGRSHPQKWERQLLTPPKAFPFSCVVCKPQCSLMRSTLSSRGSWEERAVQHPTAQGRASESACPSAASLPPPPSLSTRVPRP